MKRYSLYAYDPGDHCLEISKEVDMKYGEWVKYEDVKPVLAQLEQHQLTPEPTEEMIDAPRGFLIGLELGSTTLEDMRKHLDMYGDDYSCWPDWAKTDTGHITQAAKAILIYTMMEAARAK